MISLFFCQQQTNYEYYNFLHNETKCESFCLQRLIAQALIWLRSSTIESGIFLWLAIFTYGEDVIKSTEFERTFFEFDTIEQCVQYGDTSEFIQNTVRNNPGKDWLFAFVGKKVVRYTHSFSETHCTESSLVP